MDMKIQKDSLERAIDSVVFYFFRDMTSVLEAGFLEKC